MAASRHAFLGIAVLATVLAVLPGEASSARNDRRDDDAEALFPKATRDVAEGRVSSRLQRQINAMIEALNDDEDPEKARRIADELGGALRLYPRQRGGARALLLLPQDHDSPAVAPNADGRLACASTSC